MVNPGMSEARHKITDDLNMLRYIKIGVNVNSLSKSTDIIARMVGPCYLTELLDPIKHGTIRIMMR